MRRLASRHSAEVAASPSPDASPGPHATRSALNEKKPASLFGRLIAMLNSTHQSGPRRRHATNLPRGQVVRKIGPLTSSSSVGESLTPRGQFPYAQAQQSPDRYKALGHRNFRQQANGLCRRASNLAQATRRKRISTAEPSTRRDAMPGSTATSAPPSAVSDGTTEDRRRFLAKALAAAGGTAAFMTGLPTQAATAARFSTGQVKGSRPSLATSASNCSAASPTARG